MRTHRTGTYATILAAALVAGPALASDIMIYPKKGQSQEQQEKDRFECHTWAVQQSGFDPSNPAASAPVSAAPPQQSSSGGLARGAARGAAVGAVGGAIAGDAGKGAAAGAAAGGLVGGMKRRDESRQQQQAEDAAAAQQQAAIAQKRESYKRAITACLEARDYSVK